MERLGAFDAVEVVAASPGPGVVAKVRWMDPMDDPDRVRLGVQVLERLTDALDPSKR